MNSLAVAFLVINSAALLIVPKRLAPMPLLIGACYMTLGQGIEIGPFSFTVIRMLVVVGFARIFLRGERLTGGFNGLDWLMVIWACWALVTSFFREDVSSALVFRLGLVFNTCGIYFLMRFYCESLEDLRGLLCVTAILLLPVAFEMIHEHVRQHNLFAILGGVPEYPAVREGAIRAQGPFRHPILAGTVGAVSLPLMVGLWSQHRKTSLIGMFSCVTIIYCSSSSGPVASALAGIGGLFMWHYRHRMKLVRWVAVIGYIALDVAMKVPAYYLMARIPIVDGSTGWHRARLIQSAFQHLNEWWVAGTEYTRHWMPTGVSWSPNHTDITNHYIQMGVIGGLPLMILFILILAKGFSYVGEVVKTIPDGSPHKFMVWALGASLFANAATMISVSYFDQSFLFLYLTLGAIGSTWSAVVQSVAKSEMTADGAGSVNPKMQPAVGK